MIRIGFAFAIAFIAGGSARAASPDPKYLAVPPAELARAQELVRALGSEDYTEREEAQKALAKMGRMARPALIDAACTNPSAEVRSRASRLLPRAEAEELKARLDTFLADDDLQYDHDLPGWGEFRVAVGAEWRLFGTPLYKDVHLLKAARTVYIDMLESPSNRSLVYAVGGLPTELGSAVGARKAELYTSRFGGRGLGGRGNNFSAIDIITLLFAESQVPSRYIPTTRVVSMTSFLMNSVGVHGSDERSIVYRAVATYWMETRDDAVSQYQAMMAANTLNMPGPGTRLALKLLADTKGLPVYRAQAAVNLVRFDAKDALPELEKAMGDASVVTSLPVGMNVAQPYESIQVRDVALVAALVLNRQRPEDYGFMARTNYGSGTSLTSYMQWSYPSGSWSATFTRRAMALAKYAEWREQNLGAGKSETVK